MIRSIKKCFLCGAAEYLILLPEILILSFLFFLKTDQILFIVLTLFAYPIGALSQRFLSKGGSAVFLPGLLYLIFSEYLITKSGFSFLPMISVCIAVLFLFWRGRLFSQAPWQETLNIQVIFVFILLDLIILLTAGFSKELSHFILFINTATVVSAVVCALCINRVNLLSNTFRSAEKQRPFVTKNFFLQNTLLTFGAAASAALLSVLCLFTTLFGWIGKGCVSLLRLIFNQKGDMISPPEELHIHRAAAAASENSFIDLLLNLISKLFTLLLILFMLWLVYKAIKKIIKAILNYKTSVAVSEDAAIVSEETEFIKKPRKYLLKREPGWNSFQTSREKIRFLYRKLIRKAVKRRFQFITSKTPSETLDSLLESKTVLPDASAPSVDRLNALYNEARYKETDPFCDSKDIEKLKKDLSL